MNIILIVPIKMILFLFINSTLIITQIKMQLEIENIKTVGTH